MNALLAFMGSACLLGLAQDERAFVARCKVAAADAKVEVGAPVALELFVQDPSGSAVEVDAANIEGDGSWVLLAAKPLVFGADAKGPFVRARFELASLEAGVRELPTPAVRLAGDVVAVEPCSLEFVSALATDEDAPRPMRGFLDEDAPAARATWKTIGLVLLLAGLLIAAAWWRRRRARAFGASQSGAELDPLLELCEQEPLALEGAHKAREAHAILVQSLRSRASSSGRAPDGLTDREWAERIAPRLASDAARRELQRLIEESEVVKYGPSVPTGWATRDRLLRARKLVEQEPNVFASLPGGTLSRKAMELAQAGAVRQP